MKPILTVLAALALVLGLDLAGPGNRAQAFPATIAQNAVQNLLSERAVAASDRFAGLQQVRYRRHSRRHRGFRRHGFRRHRFGRHGFRRHSFRRHGLRKL